MSIDQFDHGEFSLQNKSRKHKNIENSKTTDISGYKLQNPILNS